MDASELISDLTKGLTSFTWGNALMITVGLVLIGLAIIKEYEPVLLLPIGFGCILANIPMAGMTDGNGLFGVLYRAGISTELFPLLIFIGVGAMIDFSPLLSQPKMVLLGAAGQFGIFGTLILATLLGKRLPLVLLALLMVRPPFLLQPSWLPTCWRRSRSRRILI
jgi:carboxybiotin decarboxylase